MAIHNNHPDRTEYCVERVMPLRPVADEDLEKYEAFFQQFNEQMRAHFQEDN